MAFKTCLYYSNWSVYQKKHFVQDIPVHLVTNIFYAFIGIDESTGTVKLTDPWADIELPMPPSVDPSAQSKGSINSLIKLKEQNRNLKVSLSIGGWGTAHLFKAVMATPEKLQNFVTSSVKMCRQYGFDGIDIDWEYPETAQEASQLTLLLSKLRSELDRAAPGLLLTIAAPASGDKIDLLQVSEMDRHLSFWNLMCYDYCGSWSSKTGYHSNLFGDNGDNSLNSSDVVQKYLAKGISSPQKLILGMPNYGRSFVSEKSCIGSSFNGCDGNGTEGGIVLYKNLPLNHSEECFDAKKVSAYCHDKSSNLFVVYDNPQSARVKAMFVKSNNLGGGMWWESCGDSFQDPSRSLLHNFVDQLGHDLEGK